MAGSLLWVAGTGVIAAVFGFAAIVLWLLERVSSVPPLRHRFEEGDARATDAAMMVGGALVCASLLLDPSALFVLPLGLAIVTLGAVPFLRDPVRRQAMRVLALLLFVAVHVVFRLTR
jgi:hypothetical protein